jgi:molybdopterin-containing oxidoreductase family membrane subunit
MSQKRTNVSTEILAKPPVVGPGHTAGSVTDKISEVVLSKTPKWWFPAFGGAFLLMNLLFLALAKLFFTGTGIWGLNMPIGWGFAIINFVWWIGIGHAGTLISAILLLLRQRGRSSEALYSGMYSRSRPTRRLRCCFGTSA